MQRTISIKINLQKEFLNYLELCSTIFNRYIDWCFENKTYNKNKAHEELYSILRKEYPTIPSATIQSLRDSALESVKALKFKFKPFKKPHTHIRYDKRTVSLKGNKLSISWSGSRIKQQINIPKFFTKRYGNFVFQAATIGYNKHQKCFKANLIFKSETPEKNNSNRSVGIDRGLYNIVSLSDGFKYPSNKIRKNKRECLFLRKQLQTKGSKSTKRKLKRLSGYEKRFSLNENHKITKQLVNMAYDIFVLEDLQGIRKQKSKGKIVNKWLSNWSFWQLEQLLTYKAEAKGKKVVKVDPRYTSQKCSNCKIVEKRNRKGSHYVCERCGYVEHADVNAAINIHDNFISAALEYPKKAEQAVCQSAKCLEPQGLGTGYQPCADSN